MVSKTISSGDPELDSRAFAKTLEEVKANAVANIEKSGSLKIDYFEIVDLHTMQPIKNWEDAEEIAICTAAFLGKVRLIDNMLILKEKT